MGALSPQGAGDEPSPRSAASARLSGLLINFLEKFLGVETQLRIHVGTA